MIMHPVPKTVDEIKVLSTVDPVKDVEGRTPENLGLLLIGNPYFTPCTAQATVEMLKYYGVQLKGKDVTIVGRSTTVGKPLSLLLLNEDATVTVCHSKTEKLIDKVKDSDIVVAAVGKPKMFNADWFKDGATVIDVGINIVEGKIVGDVDFDSVSKKCSVSKVPGGVGNVTNALLMRNVVKAAEVICKR
jgi:methylenetetrahydrofolate dehydrogenase (NADP+)/methenyltetrahydrofolate cyclohydrolase